MLTWPPDDPSRQLLREATSHSPAPMQTRSASTRANRSSLATHTKGAAPAKEVTFDISGATENAQRKVPGKLGRPSRASLPANLPSGLKRKEPEEYEDGEGHASKTRRSMGAFRDDNDWDHPVSDPDSRPEANPNGPRKRGRPKGTSKKVEAPPVEPKRGRRSEGEMLREDTAEYLEDEPELLEAHMEALPSPSRRSPRKSGGVRQVAAPESEDEPEAPPSLRTSPRAVRGGTKANEAEEPARGKPPMTTGEARATSRLQMRQQRLLLGKKGKVSVNGDLVDDSEGETIRVATNVPNLKEKARRPRPGDDDKPKLKPSALPKSKLSKGKKRKSDDDDTADGLFVIASDEDRDEEPPEKHPEWEGFDDTSNRAYTRFLGKYGLLQGMNDTISGTEYSDKPRTQPIKKFDQLCGKILALITEVEKGTTESEEGLDKEVKSLKEMTSKLNPDNSSDGKLYAHDIYRSAFPGLARVFLAHCLFFESVGGLEVNALEELSSLADMIIKLRDRAERWATKPDPRSQLVQPIRSKVIAPLKAVYQTFSKRAAELRSAELQSTQRERAYDAHCRREEREHLAKQQFNKERLLIRRLRELYLTRQEVEPDRYRRPALGLPQYVGLSRPTIDANGSEFERLNLFGYPRSKLHPAAWTTEQRLDLMEGLERFGNSGNGGVFSLIIRHYCGPHGSLRDIKVHQLLEEAADLQKDLLRAEEEDETGTFVVPDFIRNLPDMDLLDYLSHLHITTMAS